MLFLIVCYGFDSCRELGGHWAEYVIGNELKQRGRAVGNVGGYASELVKRAKLVPTLTHLQTSLFLPFVSVLFSQHLHLQGIHLLHSYLHTRTYSTDLTSLPAGMFHKFVHSR